MYIHKLPLTCLTGLLYCSIIQTGCISLYHAIYVLVVCSAIEIRMAFIEAKCKGMLYLQYWYCGCEWSHVLVDFEFYSLPIVMCQGEGNVISVGHHMFTCWLFSAGLWTRRT